MNEGATVHDYIDIVYRKKWLIVIIFFSVFLTTLYYVQRQPQLYTSSSTIYLEYSQTGIGDPSSMITLTTGSGSGRSGKGIRSLEFYLGVFDSRSFQEQVREELVKYATNLGMDPLEARRRTDFAIEVREWRHQGYYNIVSDASAPDIAYAADSIATYLFQDRCVQFSRTETRAMIEFIEEQFENARASLADAEDQLQDFRRQNNLIMLDSEGGANEGLPMEYTRLLEGYYESRKEQQAAQATLDATKQAARLIQHTLDSLALDPIGRARPAFQLDEAQEQIRRAQHDLQVKEYQTRSFTEQLSRYEETHPELSTISLTYARLSREREIHEKLATILLERREELRVQSASETGGVKVIDQPAYGKPMPSRARAYLVLGAVIGLVFGAGAAFFWETLDSNIKTAAEIPETVGTTAVGAIPTIAVGGERTPGRNGRRYRNALISEINPKDPVAEAYRALRTSLMYSAGDERLRTIVVSSAGQAEGKSITTANLGVTCAQMGQRVVIIDCDLRRPVQHTLFGLDHEGGLTEYLLQDLTLSDVTKPSGTPNLDIITSGITPPNPAPLLASPAMRERMNELREIYDLVIIDSPPIIAVTDAVILGNLSDGVLMVVRCAATPRAAAKHAATILATANVNLLGVVLNDIDIGRHYGGYYYYSYYGHYYDSYYGADRDRPATKGTAS